ncbi:MAG: PQQ-binding-like beta-propeller repeat protein [Desulfobacterales bacterium]
MKKWKKWVIGILGTMVGAVLILGALFWTQIGIIKGTEELSGKMEVIPTPVSQPLEPLTKGDTDWVSWQGAKGDNRSSVTGIIKDWSGGLEKLWEVDFLCQGSSSATWSAPVIQGNRLVVSGRNTESDLIFCLNPVNGGLLWHKTYQTKATGNHGRGPRATPAIDEDRVYTFGRSGDLASWALFDGKERWRTNVTDEAGKEPTWGFSSSPLVLGTRVLVQAGGTARTIAYDKITGKVAWKSGSGSAGYAALTRMDIAGKSMVLAFHGKGLAALDPESGEEAWNVPWKTNYDVNASTPITSGDSIFVTSGYGTGGMLLKAGASGAEILWQSKAIAAQHSDPYIIDGVLYGYSGDSFQNKGAFKSVSLADGTEKWATNKMGWGTCTYVDGHLLCIDIKGNLFLMRPDPDRFVEVARIRKALGDIKGPVWTKPVIANGLLYLRFRQRLVCYRLVGK